MWIATEPTESPPSVGCRWPVASNCDINPGDLPDEVIEWTKQAAIEILWAATGRQYGICSRTVRPCFSGCEQMPTRDAWDLVGTRGIAWGSFSGWGASFCGGCRKASCDCSTVEEIRLWNKRIRAVTEVMVDGVVLGPSLYRRDGTWLIRLPGAPVVIPSFDEAVVTPGVSTVLSPISITGPVSDAGVAVGLDTGAHLISLGAARTDGRVTIVLSGGDTIIVPASVVGVTGEGEQTGNTITGTGGPVVLALANGTQSFTITVSNDVTLTQIQWSDLTAANPGWPRCQDRNVAPGQPGTWSVTYDFGRQVPMGGQVAAGILACEFALAFTDGQCSLPQRIQTKVVDGMTIGFIDPMTFLDKGMTGLGGVVDQWIITTNPARLSRRGRSYRADDPRRARPRR